MSFSNVGYVINFIMGVGCKSATVNIQIKLGDILIRYNCRKSSVSGSRKSTTHANHRIKREQNTTKSEIHTTAVKIIRQSSLIIS
jgi:hypothetical protein